MAEREIFQTEEPAGPPRQLREIEPALLANLQDIAQVVGGDFGMKVEIGPPGGGSFFDPQKVKIVFDPLQIGKKPEQAEFIAGHEGGHRAIERGPRPIGAREEFWQELGFGYLMNMIADCADNSWVGRKYEGLKDRMGRVYSEIFSKENALLTTPEVDRIIATLGYEPKFAHWGSEIMRHWFSGGFSPKLDSDVEEALSKTLEPAQRSWQTIPSLSPRETEVLEEAKQRFIINRREIWPAVKELVEKDKIDEKLRQMLEEAIRQGDFQKAEKGKGGLEIPIDQLPEDLRKELEKKLKEARGKRGEDLEEEIKDIQEKLKEATGKEKEDLETKLKETQKEKEDLESGESQPVPIDELGEELKEKLKEIFEGLPEVKKEELGQKAQRTLEDLEDVFNKGLEGKLDETKPASHQEQREREERERQREEKAKQEEAERERIKREIEKVQEAALSEYDKIYREVAPLAEELYQRLLAIFLPEKHPRWRKGFPSGGRLDLQKAMQYEADRSRYGELWERKTIPNKIDYRFVFLVDLSSSMTRGTPSKIDQTFRGLVVLNEVLNRLGLSYEVWGFQDIPIPFKRFSESLDVNKRRQFCGMLREPHHQNPGGHNQSGWNSDGFCLSEVSRELEENKGKNNFLIVLSDGLPTPDPAHTKPELSQAVEVVKRQTDQKLVGIGIGPGTEHVKDFYPASLPGVDLKDLPGTLANLFEDILRNPQKY